MPPLAVDDDDFVACTSTPKSTSAAATLLGLLRLWRRLLLRRCRLWRL